MNDDAGRTRLAIHVRGVVQGVGFRPFVYREARGLGLVGWVRNGPDGVRIEVQGARGSLDAFTDALRHRVPPQASISSLEAREVDLAAETEFAILESDGDAAVRPAIPADLAICADCAAEIQNPGDRRYRYPFTNCTNCGPRYSIVESVPYDRARTSMRSFELCPACAAEYRDPANRRFHAEPIACPACGPQLWLLGPDRAAIATGDDALKRAAAEVRAGKVLALKGLGGFQILVDATNAQAVATLRERKHREEKPFAVMFPSLVSVRDDCEISTAEGVALASAEAPIVLLSRRTGITSSIVEGVAPKNPWLGALVPYTPLHLLLMAEIKRPVVCTSGNLTDEPMCIDNDEALERLGAIADIFLVHDRTIVRPVDDSIARMSPQGLGMLRRARGYAPLPMALSFSAPPILAVGAQMKSSVALSVGGQIVQSQHLGDMDSAEGAALLERTVEDMVRFFDVRPEIVACDMHPDYASTRIAERLAARFGARIERVQHHHAHVAACAAEHGLTGEILGLAWDGTGYGDDGTIWGGEALVCDDAQMRRAARLRPFALPGGEAAVRDPRRAALGVMFQVLDPVALRGLVARRWFDAPTAEALAGLLERSAHCPLTSSVGRLFDAVSALAGACERNNFEGQAAMQLEYAAEGVGARAPYPVPLENAGGMLEADWRPLMHDMFSEIARGWSAGEISARFHESLAALAATIAGAVGIRRVALGGGCFQNARLSRLVRARLEKEGFEVFCPRLVPPNDGGISLGQLAVAAARAMQIQA
jgi:hydrogenase maturation protein HypF